MWELFYVFTVCKPTDAGNPDSAHDVSIGFRMHGGYESEMWAIAMQL